MTDRIALTKALISAMAHSSLPMVLSDPHQPDCPVIAANRAFLNLTLYPLGEIVGRNCRFLQGPDTDRATLKHLRESIAAGAGCIEYILNYRKDGTRFWNMLFLTPIFDTSGKLVYFLGNQRDASNGLPPALQEMQIGRAHMSAPVEARFYRLLTDILTDTKLAEDSQDDARAQALERIIENAREVGEVTMRLEPEG